MIANKDIFLIWKELFPDHLLRMKYQFPEGYFLKFHLTMEVK